MIVVNFKKNNIPFNGIRFNVVRKEIKEVLNSVKSSVDDIIRDSSIEELFEVSPSLKENLGRFCKSEDLELIDVKSEKLESYLALLFGNAGRKDKSIMKNCKALIEKDLKLNSVSGR